MGPGECARPGLTFSSDAEEAEPQPGEIQPTAQAARTREPRSRPPRPEPLPAAPAAPSAPNDPELEQHPLVATAIRELGARIVKVEDASSE